jgi:hypothetical protein
VVECVRLESVYVRKDIAGSNPAPSAKSNLALSTISRLEFSPAENFWLTNPPIFP